MKILIVAEHASARLGGEAALPLHYYRVLRARGHDVWLLIHERTRQELEARFGHDSRIIYVADTRTLIFLWRLGHLLPTQIAAFTTGYLKRVLTQRQQVLRARQLVADEGIEVVHQPMPVSPREPSQLCRMSVPVVIGPMNGGMHFPPAFHFRVPRAERWFMAVSRRATNLMNRLFSGKRQASAILVANERTRQALPEGISGRIVEIVENGVDLSIWSHHEARQKLSRRPQTKFVFVGRLVDWKAVDILLEAFLRVRHRAPMSLEIIGDGPDRAKLEAYCAERQSLSSSDTAGNVSFTGWLSQQDCATRLRMADVLVLPSLYECGGAVVLEAMASSLPVIATAWGGPLDYLDPSCGYLVPPDSHESLVAGIADAMLQLASSPELAREMGLAGAAKVKAKFDWEVKVDTVLGVYRQAIADCGQVRD